MAPLKVSALACLGLLALFVACSSDEEPSQQGGAANTPLETPPQKPRDNDARATTPTPTPTRMATAVPTPSTTPPPPPVEATFESLDARVFKSRCVVCHSGTTPAARIDLSSYEGMRAAQTFPPLITPLDPKASLLFEVVETGRMPMGGKLAQSEIAALEAWIESGARKSESDPLPTPVPTPTEPPD